jgi:hypothetical protein
MSIPGRLRNSRTRHMQRKGILLGTILLIVVILLLVGAFPSWGHSREWGYGPTGGLSIVLLVLVVLLLTGHLHAGF